MSGMTREHGARSPCPGYAVRRICDHVAPGQMIMSQCGNTARVCCGPPSRPHDYVLVGMNTLNAARSVGKSGEKPEESCNTAVACLDGNLSITCLDVPLRGLRMNHEQGYWCFVATL